MKMNDFLFLVKGQVNKGIYVWGANGELLKDIDAKWIKSHETSDTNYKKALEMFEKRRSVAGARAFDCSGLVCWGLRECGAKDKGFDKTAEGLRQMCSKTTKAQLKDGDLCFKISDGKAHHVGVFISGKIIEAKGRAYGVVQSNVTSSWDAFGRLEIKWDTEPDAPKQYVLTRLLKKGCSGDDVRDLQTKLIKLGYNLKPYGGADGIFGKGTDKIVRQFQVDKKLKADGIVGEKTAKALGWAWMKG